MFKINQTEYPARLNIIINEVKRNQAILLQGGFVLFLILLGKSMVGKTEFNFSNLTINGSSLNATNPDKQIPTTPFTNRTGCAKENALYDPEHLSFGTSCTIDFSAVVGGTLHTAGINRVGQTSVSAYLAETSDFTSIVKPEITHTKLAEPLKRPRAITIIPMSSDTQLHIIDSTTGYSVTKNSDNEPINESRTLVLVKNDTKSWHVINILSWANLPKPTIVEWTKARMIEDSVSKYLVAPGENNSVYIGTTTEVIDAKGQKKRGSIVYEITPEFELKVKFYSASVGLEQIAASGAFTIMGLPQ